MFNCDNACHLQRIVQNLRSLKLKTILTLKPSSQGLQLKERTSHQTLKKVQMLWKIKQRELISTECKFLWDMSGQSKNRE